MWNVAIMNFFMSCTGLPCSSHPGDLSLRGVTFSLQTISCKRNDYHRLEGQRSSYSCYETHLFWFCKGPDCPICVPADCVLSDISSLFFCFFSPLHSVPVHAWLIGIGCIRGNYRWTGWPTIPPRLPGVIYSKRPCDLLVLQFDKRVAVQLSLS